MRLSRWGWSRYETVEALEHEARRLTDWVEVVEPRSDAEIIVVNSGTPVDASLLEQAPSVRLCVTNTSGFEHLHRAALASRGVVAARLPMARRDPVVESSLWGIIHGLRRHSELLDAAASGLWMRPELPRLGARKLQGSKAVIVGLGVIGKRMVEVLQGLGMEVVGVDPNVSLPGLHQAPLDEAIHGADVLSLHCSMQPEDEGMVGEALLRQAKRGLVLVNTARGALVRWKDAREALRGGQLSAMVMDVFPEEPWVELRAEPGLVMTPHSAGYHSQLSAVLAEELRDTVAAFVSGQGLPHPVYC